MSDHLNFLGLTFWVREQPKTPPNPGRISGCRLYSPKVLVAYCILGQFPAGVFLYGINLFRRGFRWRGKLLCILSASLLIASIGQGMLAGETFEYRSNLSLDELVAVHLYGIEKFRFEGEMRRGGKPARWWMPSLWIATTVIAWFLLRTIWQWLFGS